MSHTRDHPVYLANVSPKAYSQYSTEVDLGDLGSNPHSAMEAGLKPVKSLSA